MKRIISNLIIIVLLAIILIPQEARTQIPQNMSYQAVIRNTDNELITEQDIGMQISILKGSSNGTAVYVETQSATTNLNGLVTVEIGSGTIVSGNFETIDWGADTYFIKTETDPNGGTNYTITGVSQLLSVPFALYSREASKAELLGNEGVYSTTSDTLFVVKDHDGNVVFLVFPDGAEVIVNEAAKGKVGGFAISGRSPNKATDLDILRITADSTRIYVNDSVETKGKVGGFAISGRSPNKGTEIDYFNISGSETTEVLDPSKARILWYPNKEAFLVGRVLIESPDSVGTNSMATGFESKAIGNYSQALGYQAIARGNNSTAIGNIAVVDSANSYAFGNNTYVGGANSYALGDSAYTIGENSYAIGAGAQASGNYSFAIGSRGIVDVFGPSFPVDAPKALGNFSYAFGTGNVASNTGSMAIGAVDTVTGQFAIAIGVNNNATGQGSYALGSSTTSSGLASTTLGNNTIASGTVSTAMGQETKARGTFSTSMGYRTIANSFTETVIGQFNDTIYSETEVLETNPVFIVGNGSGDDNRKNALMVLKSGNTGIGGYPGTTGTNVLAIKAGDIPGTSLTDGIIMYADTTGGTNAVLKVRDEDGNVTTTSPHTFSLIEKSEPMAWSFFSENNNIGYRINVDMLKAIRTIEALSGVKLVYLQDMETSEIVEQKANESLVEIINQQKEEIDELKKKIDGIMKLLEKE